MTDAGSAAPLTVQERYTSTPLREAFARELDQSLQPRNGDMLFDLVGTLGLGPDSRILDVGCGTGRAACRLAERARAIGPSALVIRAADMLDNAAYLHGPEGEDPDLWRYLLDKLRDFLAISEVTLHDDPVWHVLRERHQELAGQDGSRGGTSVQ